MDLEQRKRILDRLGGEEGKVNDNHTFIVRNTEKAFDKQYWTPIPGSVITGFLSGSHEWKYVGPSNSAGTYEFLAKLDEAQKGIVGIWPDAPEANKPIEDGFEVAISIEALGIGVDQTDSIADAPLESILAAPKSRKKVTA